jgi:hypothetical protein
MLLRISEPKVDNHGASERHPNLPMQRNDVPSLIGADSYYSADEGMQKGFTLAQRTAC